jgi:tRNA acetyltransferase TAN1
LTAALESDNDADDDIEAQIRREIEGLKPGAPTNSPFQAIKLDTACCESPVFGHPQKV